MAADKSVNPENQEVDLDELEVVILIIAKNPHNITQAANFLTRRGWPTSVTGSVSQAIEQAADRKPDYVLISVNHPSPSMAKFSDVLTNTFNTTCVAFAEGLDAASGARLSKSKLPLKITGQASGPNLHRSLRRILAEKFNIQLEDKATVNSSEKSLAERTIKGEKVEGDGTRTFTRGESAAEGKTSSLTTIKGESGLEPEYGDAEVDSVSSAKYTMAKKNRKSLKDLASEGGRSPILDSGNSADLAEKLRRSLFGENGPQKEDEISEEASVETQPLSSKGIPTAQPAGGSSRASMVLNPAKNSPSTSARSAEQRESKETASSPGTHGWAPDKQADESKEDGRKPITKRVKEASEENRQLQSSVENGLERICRPAADTLMALTSTEQVGVFPVESPAFPGYLVLAWPHEEMRAIEPFFKQAQAIIQSVFNETNIQAHLEPGFFVTLPPVDFSAWGKEKAAFSFITTHGSGELGVAFFPTFKPIPKPRPGSDKNMFSIGLENISTEHPVTFKMYLHLKKNKKYFLYLRNGRQLQPEQKNRLEGNQVTDLYMKTIDVENLRAFLASCYLRETLKKDAA